MGENTWFLSEPRQRYFFRGLVRMWLLIALPGCTMAGCLRLPGALALQGGKLPPTPTTLPAGAAGAGVVCRRDEEDAEHQGQEGCLQH